MTTGINAAQQINNAYQLSIELFSSIQSMVYDLII